MQGAASTGGVLLHVLVRWIKRVSGIAAIALAAIIYVNLQHSGSRRHHNILGNIFVHEGFPNGDETVTARFAEGDDPDRRYGRHLASSSSSGNTTSCGGNGGSGTEATLEGTLCFLLSCCAICSLLDHLNLLIPFNLRFPISVVMFISGKVFGYFVVEVIPEVSFLHNAWVGVYSASHMNPHAVFYILLPPLLYESASSLDWFVFKKVLPSSVLLALPGVLLNITLTTLLVNSIFDLHTSTGEDLNLQASLLLSTILSATDPVAVVASLHVLGAPKKLAHLIEGESLLNDGSAVVFFFVFLDMVAVGRPDDKKQCVGNPIWPSFHCVLFYFLRLALGGVIIGLAISTILSFWVKRVSHLGIAPLQISVVLCAVYGSFFLAEACHTSGVLAVVTVGTMMTASIYPQFSHEGRHYHHIVLQEIGYICNMFIFFTAGLVSTRFMFTEKHACNEDPLYKQARTWGELLALYFWIHVTRLVVVVIFSPILKRIGYGIKWKEASMLIYGGLRGAVGLAMGLMVEHDEYVDKNIAAQIAFHTSGIVLMTLCINGSTVDELYNRLEPYPPNPYRLNHIRKVLCTVEDACRKVGLQELYRHWFFHDVEFTKILSCVPHFGHIEFESSGVAVPMGIQSVSETLRSLAKSAAKIDTSWIDKEDFTRVASTRSNADNFNDRWTRRKDDLQEKCRKWLECSGTIHGSVAGLAPKTTIYHDQLLAVECLGKHQLIFEGKDVVGLYISALPLSSIMYKIREFFSVKLLRSENASVHVGFFLDKTGVREVCENSGIQLGQAENSVGLDCASGVVSYNLNGRSGEISIRDDTISSGEIVELRISQEQNHSLSIGFGFLSNAPGNRKGSDIAAQNLATTDTTTETAVVAFEDEVSPLAEHNDDEIIEHFFPLGDASLEDVYPVVEFRSAILDSASDNSMAKKLKPMRMLTRVATKGEDAFNVAPTVRSEAKVALAFEPQIATDDESFNETFQVLFNTVTRHYQDMHEHGILSQKPLSWVTEAVNKGIDCLNQEMNAVRVNSFRGLESLAPEPKLVKKKSKAASTTNSNPISPMTSVGIGMPNSLGVSPASLQQEGVVSIGSGSSLAPSLGSIGSGNSLKPPPLEPPEMQVRNQLGRSPLEPLVVEYLALEHECSQKSWFEIFPPTWTWIRQFGFSRTKAKIESLWAYIEAHEATMNEFPALKQRFPEVAKCMQDILFEAKGDLEILRELRPRRFFYCKHFLALRILMHRRLDRLKHYMKDGWIAYGDCEGLIHDFQARIATVEQYIPSRAIYQTATLSQSSQVFPSEAPVPQIADAWANEDLELEKLSAWKEGESSELSTSVSTVSQKLGKVAKLFVRTGKRRKPHMREPPFGEFHRRSGSFK